MCLVCPNFQPPSHCGFVLAAPARSGAVLLAHVTAHKITPYGLCPGAPEDEEGQLQPEDPMQSSHVADVRASAWVDEVLLTAGQDSKLVAWVPRR